MPDVAYAVFRQLTQVSYNIWFPLLLLLPPLILWGKGSRVPRLLVSVALVYLLINLTLHTHHAIKRNAFEACQSQFSDGLVQMHPECPAPNTSDGAAYVFYALLGWIPAAGYVGIWEGLWRIKNRKRIEAHSVSYKWFSFILMVCSIPVVLYALLMGVIVVAALLFY